MSSIDRFSCEETFRRLDDYLDRELSAEEMARVRQHLEICAACAAEYAFESKRLQEIRSRLEHLEAPADLLRKVRRALERDRADLGPA